MALLDGVRLLLRELVEGPVRVTSNQKHLSHRILQPHWASALYRQRLGRVTGLQGQATGLLEVQSEVESEMQPSAMAQNRHEIKQQLRKEAHQPNRAPVLAKAAQQADQVVEQEHVQNQKVAASDLNDLPDLGERVAANKLNVHRGLGRLRVNWRARGELHREMMKQDAAVWSKVYTSLSDSDWTEKGDRVLMDIDAELNEPQFGGVKGPINLGSYRNTAVNERPRVQVESANGQRFEADYLVMASPLHWMTEHVEFSPSLPVAIADAMQHVGTAFSVRVHLIFDKVQV
jgi:monoamine oxidase